MDAMRQSRGRKAFTLILSLALLTIVFSVIPGSLAAAATAGGSTDPVVLDDGAQTGLAGHLYLLEDPSCRMTLADVLDPKSAVRFRRLNGDLNMGYNHSAIWIRCTLLRTDRFPSSSWLRIFPPGVDYLTAYVQSGNDPVKASSYEQFRLGDHVPYAERPTMNPSFFVPLSLKAGKPACVYLRIRTSGTVTASAAVHTSHDMVRHTYANILMQGGNLGIFLLISLLNFIYFIRIGDRIFLYFALYAFFFFIIFLSIGGMLAIVLPSVQHLVSDALVGIGFGGATITMSVFLARIFADELSPVSRVFLHVIVLLGWLLTVSPLLGLYTKVASLSLIGLMLLPLFVTNWLNIKAFRKKAPLALLYLVTFGLMNIGLSLHFLRQVGVVPSLWWNTYNLQVISLLHVVFISIALGERLHAAEKRALLAARGSERKAVELAHDMTGQIRESQASLEVALASEKSALEQQRRFLSMLSHEYRTPLTVIRGNLGIIDIQESAKKSDYQEELAAMHLAVDRLVEVMDVSLERSRLNDTEIEGETVRMEFAPFIASQVETVQAMWPRRRFMFSETANQQEIACSPKGLRTVIFNLLDNARKYSPPDSPVEIECRIEHDEAVMTIRNQGTGIDPEEEPLFEKYARGRNSSGTSGAGIGLWLVRHIIGQHKGTVELEASGACIIAIVRLPLAGTTGQAAEIPLASPSAASASL
jgi:signal transduction histidine kinase